MGSPLTPWTPGTLDIHHIATNRGDSTLIISPDGTSILIDAGATREVGPAVMPARPNAKRRPGEWIARYVRRHIRRSDTLDYLVVTHLHPDHISGIADVARSLRIGRLIDPDYPDYGYPPFEDAVASQNYIAYVRERESRGESVERFRVGSGDQIPGFRNLAAKGIVWSGRDEETTAVFASREKLAPGDYPNVNAGSIAMRLRFGAFKYFCAGDLTDWADAGTRSWMDALTPAAQACGHVDVAVAPHHGLFDSTGTAMVRALAARVWIISTWHASHPSITTLERLFNQRIYSGPRSVYTTGLSSAADLTAHRLTSRLASTEGHVVIRVAKDSRSYQTVVTSNRDERDIVTSMLTSSSRELSQAPT